MGKRIDILQLPISTRLVWYKTGKYYPIKSLLVYGEQYQLRSYCGRYLRDIEDNPRLTLAPHITRNVAFNGEVDYAIPCSLWKDIQVAGVELWQCCSCYPNNGPHNRALGYSLGAKSPRVKRKLQKYFKGRLHISRVKIVTRED